MSLLKSNLKPYFNLKLTRHWNKLTGLSSQERPARVAASWSALPPEAADRTGKKSSRWSSLNSSNHCRRYRSCASDVNPGQTSFLPTVYAHLEVLTKIYVLPLYWRLKDKLKENLELFLNNATSELTRL